MSAMLIDEHISIVRSSNSTGSYKGSKLGPVRKLNGPRFIPLTLFTNTEFNSQSPLKEEREPVSVSYALISTHSVL